MNLLDIVQRTPNPVPWDEGEKIPWNAPDFSRRMLREHLSQEHDHASRRVAIIDQQVNWLHIHILAGKPTSILDLGCGPGLYSSRLAKLGHSCVGIDFSPASIDYARRAAEHLACSYSHEDIRTADYGSGYGLAMLIFGEFNVFTPADARVILRKAHNALSDQGVLVLEPHPRSAIQQIGEQPRSWYAVQKGLFSDKPYIYLHECFWDEAHNVTTQRYYIVDASTGHVTRYASSMQGYSDAEYRGLLTECGFGEVSFYPSLTGNVSEISRDLIAITARKAG